MNFEIVTSPVDASTALAWNECLDRSQLATQYTSPAFLSEVYFQDKRPFAVLATHGGVVEGVLTGFFDRREVVCGTPASPHVNLRSGADVNDVATALIKGLRSHTRGSANFISIYSWTPMAAFEQSGLRSRVVNVPLCTYLLDLSKGKDQLLRSCSETRRNKIRRAIKAGVDVAVMNLERDFAEYYDLYSDWCAFKNVARQSADIQRRAFQAKESRLVLVARHEGRIVGVSTFRFRRPGVVEYAANVSRREESKVRQNDLLLWRGVEWAVEQGDFRYFSTAGAHFFLAKFGGDLQLTYRYTLDRTVLRQRHAAEDIRRVARRAFEHLPSGVQRISRQLLRRPGESE